jgi:hypothetical protein
MDTHPLLESVRDEAEMIVHPHHEYIQVTDSPMPVALSPCIRRVLELLFDDLTVASIECF